MTTTFDFDDERTPGATGGRKWPVPVRIRSRATVELGVLPLIRRYHGYGGAGSVGQWWAAYEHGVVKAAWLWTPPLPSAAASVAPPDGVGVLSLARMVAVPGPRSDNPERDWHISKPLRWLMRHGIDRGRWPVLVTYSDAGQGHDGAVYRFSGWEFDGGRTTRNAVDAEGVKRSRFANGRTVGGLVDAGASLKTRWVHRVCPPGQEANWLAEHGWRRVPTGRAWASGAPAYRWVFDDARVYGYSRVYGNAQVHEDTP